MMNILKTALIHLIPRRLLPRADEKGQSLIILTFAFLGLIAMMGLALDLGLVYITRVRVKRTVDAAALGAVFELPIEEAAVTKAMDLIDSNGYPLDSINVYVAGCVQDLQDRDGDGITDEMINLPTGDINNILINPTDVLTPTTADTMFYLYNRDVALDNAPNFFIDTRSFQDREETDGLCDAGDRVVDASDFGSANKIRVSANLPVRMNFMQFFGFGSVPVPDASIAENASTLDVALVLDTTGSMEYDTICYGCWERCDSAMASDCTAVDIYKPYPTNGRAFPFPYPPNPAITSTLTVAQQRMQTLIVGEEGDDSVWPPTSGLPDPQGTDDYIILEAEFYSDNTSNWDPNLRANGQGYWAIQRQTYERGEDSGDDPGGAWAIDGYGYEGGSPTNNDLLLDGLVRHHPNQETSDTSHLPFGRHYTAADAQNDVSPRLDYDFKPGAGPEWNTPVYVHFKAQWYGGGAGNNSDPKDQFFWAIYRDDGINVFPGGNSVVDQRGGEENDHSGGWQPSGEWDWITANTNTVLDDTRTYTLRVWAGSAGYAFDRFIISTASNVSAHWRQPATPGTAQRMAADPCNPIFGLNVLQGTCTYMSIFGPTNNLNNPLYNALDPMRGAQQAMHNFVTRLDPELDQAGFVDFDNDAGQRVQMECLRASRGRANAGSDQSGYPFNTAGYPDYDETECNDPAQVSASGRRPISYTLVFKGIEDAYPPGGGTDVADGMRRGLHLLGIDTDDDGDQENNCEWRWNSSRNTWQIRQADGTGGTDQPTADRSSNPTGHCSRGAAATSIMILLTDGAPTDGTPGDDDDCKAWGDSNSAPYGSFPMGDDKYECIMYYADIAAARGVIVYTIGLGAGADPDLLKAVADTTRGQYYFAPSAVQLDLIFDQILSNVYVRLLQ